VVVCDSSKAVLTGFGLTKRSRLSSQTGFGFWRCLLLGEPGTILWAILANLFFLEEVHMATGAILQLAFADPVKVDPKRYKVEFENDKVWVLRTAWARTRRLRCTSTLRAWRFG